MLLDATLPPVGAVPQVDTHARYLERHLPGAVFFDIDDLSDHSTPLPHMLPAADEFARRAGALGISDTGTIVVYEQENVFSAPRAWWMLRTFGARQVYVLNGGLSAWIEAGLPTEFGAVHRAPTTFNAFLNAEAVKNLPQLKQLLDDRQTRPQILDARSSGRFDGTAPEPRPGLSSGHMPGATSLPFTELLEAGRLRPEAELRKLVASRGIDLQQPITTTCGSGVTAAVIALSLEIIGAKQVALYDGSWAEYAQQPDSAIHKNT